MKNSDKRANRCYVNCTTYQIQHCKDKAKIMHADSCRSALKRGRNTISLISRLNATLHDKKERLNQQFRKTWAQCILQKSTECAASNHQTALQILSK